MKAVILAGGLGTRISEVTHLKPKPMIEIGGRPILWHIMKMYSAYGIDDFIICCGYKGYQIKEYFANYFLHTSDVTIDMRNNSTSILQQFSEPWKVTLVDTGENTLTGGRIKRIASYLDDVEPFCLTYGDGVSDLNIRRLIDFHNEHGLMATLTATYPPARFGVINVRDDRQVLSFKEKPKKDGMINGGFFVLSPKILDFIENDNTIWEGKPLEELARIGQLKSYPHEGFWQCMDTLRDKEYLEALWSRGSAPWEVWK